MSCVAARSRQGVRRTQWPSRQQICSQVAFGPSEHLSERLLYLRHDESGFAPPWAFPGKLARVVGSAGWTWTSSKS